MSNQLKEEPKKTPETYGESFRPALYRYSWGAKFAMITSGTLALFWYIYFSADWAKFLLGGAVMALLFGIIWIVLAYSYRQEQILEGNIEPEHSFWIELLYGIPVKGLVLKDEVSEESEVKSENKISTIQPPTSQSPLVESPKPNIVCLETDRVSFFEYDGTVFRNYKGGEIYSAIVVYFENKIKNRGKVASIERVKAQISYFSGEHEMEMGHTNFGCWVDENLPEVTFNLEHRKALVLGVIERPTDNVVTKTAFLVYGYSPEQQKQVLKVGLDSGNLTIKVKLVMGEYGELSKDFEFYFSQNKSGSYQFRQVKRNEISKKQKN